MHVVKIILVIAAGLVFCAALGVVALARQISKNGYEQ